MGRFAKILEGAAEKTNRELDGEISALTRLRSQDLQRLVPTRSDKEKLLELLEIVNSSATHNGKVLALKRNIDDFAGVIVKTLRLLA